MSHERVRLMIPVLVCFIVLSVRQVGAQICPALTDEVRSKVAAYVADRYEFAPDLKVDDEGTAGNSCFRRIAIRVPGRKQSLELFLSPDQQFLSETLLDMTITPTDERRRVARETLSALRAESSPFQGPGDAPVLLVVFSDFQCPFCKRFTEFLDSLPTSDRQRVGIVFKQRPLAMHPWARRAALASVCASFEGNGAFWSLEGFLFANQNTITPINLEDKIGEFARKSGELTSIECTNASGKKAPKRYFCGMRSWLGYTTLIPSRRCLSTEFEALASARRRNFRPSCTQPSPIHRG